MTKKRLVGLLLGAVLLSAGVAAATRAQATTETTTVETGQVTRATLSAVVESAGSVTPAAKVTLTFGASGTVKAVNVSAGQTVRRGEVLAELDTTDLELQVAQAQQTYLSQQAAYSLTVTPDEDAVTAAQLALSNAQAAYQLARQKYAVNSTDAVALACSNLDSAKQTYDDAVTAYNNYVSNWRVQVNGTADISPQKAQLERATAAYEQAVANCNLTRSSVNASGVTAAYAALVQAQANLEALINPSASTLTAARIKLAQAQLALEQAQQALTDARIIAPFDGVVSAVSAVAGASGSGASITLLDTSAYHVDVLIDETEINQVQVGQTAKLTFDALSGVTLTGTVTRVAPAGTVSNGVVNYAVRVGFEPGDEALRADMTAEVSIVTDTHADVLAVPGSAIRSDSGGYYVNVAGDDGTPQRVAVVAGYTDGDLTEVAGNLTVGQAVYLGDLSTTTTSTQQPGLNLFGLRIGGR